MTRNRKAVDLCSRTLVTLACVIEFSSVFAGQSLKSATPIGMEGIERVLTSRERWTVYWDVGDMTRPRFGSTTADRSPSATLEFMRVGSRLLGHAENDQVHHLECEFEVTVQEDGFTFAGCVGPDKRMTYDQEDSEYPFKGLLAARCSARARPGVRRDHSREHPARPVLGVEVSESTFLFDREHKGSLYARAGLAEYWVVNLVDRIL